MLCKAVNTNKIKVIDSQTDVIKNSEQPENPYSLPSSALSNTLDLSKRKLCHLHEDLYKDTPFIQNIHLEWNALSSVPENLFIKLPCLIWLDLRYNQITSLPATIGEHRQLKYLLLEGNPLKALPVELGDLPTLKALNLRNCPLEFPPEDVVHKGLESILSFLRQARRGILCSEAAEAEMPAVEKLSLQDVVRSSLEASEEWESNDERLRFEMLKNRLKEEEMNEIAEGRTIGLPSITQEASRLIKRNKWNFITDPRCPAEDRALAAQKRAEDKERLAAINKKLKEQDILKDWQKQTKNMQIQKERNRKTPENQIPKALPPYATDLDPVQRKDHRDKQRPLSDEKSRVASGKLQRETEKERVSKDHRLDNRIRQHIQTMKQRRSVPQATALQEVMAARKDLEEATKLQAELLQRKKAQELEYRFSAFTGEISPTPSPQGKPQNIFVAPL
ncbi:leucine-rich repeat-containing protein 27 [Xenopus laevis]|uniref:Leucine-rich repeat-containing protein 27 n=2 Tax=Xenopus laevis TaxID=8355 RepID=A0A1L8FJ21_XENLA|nr:leucine-rich repeat-containing protein 27 [Xenopus laevis]XP_018080648.1 leucine-rich repeat-containing protein 27 [Xenopus laevis]XP_018080649.1 leucine-rich repeat-containing protein 27 [Xenopus laevis]XP_018080650.1 leucine-rich repeat-containing protein 27 [Xenopus laevis]OCT71583.1 hypothetical protein XELAEV_18034561mg [Xenopus laevis]